MKMKSHLASAFVASVCLAGYSGNAQTPTNFTGVTASVYDAAAVATGSVFLASCLGNGPSGPSFLQVMNNAGTPEVFKQVSQGGTGNGYCAGDFKLLPNGLLSSSQFTGWFDYVEGGPVVNQLLDTNLNAVETVTMGNGFQSESHDFQLMANGHVLMLGYYTTLADLRAVVSNAPPVAEVSGSVIQELDGNRNVIWQWRSWDHFNWSQFSDWGAVSASGIISGWCVNAVRLDPVDGNLLVGTAKEQMKINRQTGDVMWRLGGAFNQFTFAGVSLAEGLRQVAGNDFQRLPNGDYILFNNGNADGSRTSQLHEYRLDETNKVATHVWQYVPTNNIATTSRGSVQRLANGNTFIGWGASTNGPNPDATEVTASGGKVFDLSFTNTQVNSYRAYRFPFPPDAQRIQATVPGLAAGNTYQFGNTGVRANITSISADAYNSATGAREPYAPLYPFFQGQAPLLLPVRVSISPNHISSVAGVISFDPVALSLPDPANTTVYYRTTPGQGIFVPLPSGFNDLTGLLDAELSDPGFGDFAFGTPDLGELSFPPLLIEPESLQSTGIVTRVPALVQIGKTNTVNQQLPISLSWSPKGLAGGYALQIATNATFNSPVVDEPYLLESRYFFSNALPNRTYFWRVCTYNDVGVSDWATNSFATVPPTVQVTVPNGGEAWQRGLPYIIQWNANITENIALDLYKGGVFVKTITTNSPGIPAYRWSIPVSTVPGSDYSIRIRSTTNAALFDVSDASFSIVDTPTFNSGSVVVLTNGCVQFGLTAPGAATATVLVSTNLITWQALPPLPLTNGLGVFTDNATTNFTSRFYRLSVP